jgi:hypothetical protein
VKVVQRSERLRERGALAVFVTFDDPAAVQRMLLADVACPWPVLVDRDRVAYRAWGLRRASFRELWLDPNVYRQYAQLLLRGERIRGSGRDLRQLGGDFVVDRRGVVAYSRPQQRDDRPPVGVLMNAIEEVSR